MRGSIAFLTLLVDDGVTHLFGNPGTTELPLMAALPKFPQLQYVLAAQESAVVAMADGYCARTWGPGGVQRTRRARPRERDGVLVQRELDRVAADRFKDPPIDFAALATAMGVRARRVTEANAVGTALRGALLVWKREDKDIAAAAGS